METAVFSLLLELPVSKLADKICKASLISFLWVFLWTISHILILINRIQGKQKLKHSTHLAREEKKGMKEDLCVLLHNYFKVKIIRTSLPGMMLYLRDFKLTWYKSYMCLLTVCPHIYILFLVWLLWEISFVAQQLLTIWVYTINLLQTIFETSKI